MKNTIPPFNVADARIAGHFDKRSRWYPDDEFRDIEGAFEVRTPSGNYPYSYLKHFYSLKFARLCFDQRPDLYCKAKNIRADNVKQWLINCNISQNSAIGTKLIVNAIADKMKESVCTR